jgi:peptidoglycan/LPS O-acetylase OafA/YrhL
LKLPVVLHTLKYNPSLDGIRGIAILAVLLFHIWPNIFKYGFLGVDLFFILSGYLMTQIIYNKLHQNAFSFKEFYRNRIRRIFPSAIIVLIFIIIIGYLFLFPLELKNLGKHIEASALFYENYNLINEVGYWDKAAELKPTLHFWSLAVEEQFYIFWPLILFSIYKLRLNFLKSLIIVFILSLIPLFLDINHFYNFLSRIWEFVLGGLLYAFKFNISNTNKILTFYPLVAIGIISYPLYLWHYAIISYMYILGINVQKFGLFIIIISFILSYMTYRYIEFYTRKQNSYLFAVFLFILMVIIALIGRYIYKYNGLSDRFFLVDNSKFEKQFIREKAKNKNGIILVTKILGYYPKNDYIKATTSDINHSFLVIIGDSHAHTSYPGFVKIAKKHGLETLLLANSSCPPFINAPMGKNIKDLKICKEKIDSIYNLLNSKSLKIKKVILATRANCYITDIGYGFIDGGNKPYNYHYKEFFENKNDYNQRKLFFRNLKNTFKFFNDKKYKFYYLLEDPELGFSPTNCLLRPFGIVSNQCKLPIEKFLQRSGYNRKQIYLIAQKFKNVHLLDPKNFYCDNVYCYVIKEGKMLYADDDHHSVDGAIMQAEYFEKKLFNDIVYKVFSR